MLLPDAPQASKLCHLCQLVAASEDWAKLLYTYRFDRKVGLRELPGVMQPHIDEWNKAHPKVQLPGFSSKSASKHFNKHVPTAIAMQYQAQNKGSEVARHKNELAVSSVLTPQVEAAIKKSVKVFDELQDLFTRLKSLFETYLASKPEISALSIHLDIIREMRKTLSEIGKMRQSKELIKIAVRSVIDTMLTKLIEENSRSIDDIHAKILKKTGDKAFTDELCNNLRTTSVDAVVEAARTAVERVQVEFALGDKDG